MPTELVTPETFLARLTQAFEKPDAGAVWLTAKRCEYSASGERSEQASRRRHATGWQSGRQARAKARRRGEIFATHEQAGDHEGAAWGHGGAGR